MIITESEIINELEKIELEESEKIYGKSSCKNKTVQILKNIYEDFIELKKLFHFYLQAFELDDLFESVEEENKDLEKSIRKTISSISRSIGKLDDALSKEPPKTSNDLETANNYLNKIEDSYFELHENIEKAEFTKDSSLDKLNTLLNNSYTSLVVRIDTYNERSKEQQFKKLKRGFENR